MLRWVSLLFLVVAATASGCASAPKPTETIATAFRPNSEIQPLPPTRSQQKAPPASTIRHVNFVVPAPEPVAPEIPAGALFGSDASLDDLLGFALAHNPEIQAVHMEAHALEARVPQVAALDDPLLMTTAFLEPVETAAGPQEVMLSLSQEIPWFGKRDLRGDVAYHEAQAAFARLAAAQLRVIEQVKLAYYELYFIERSTDVNRQLEDRIKQVITLAKTKYENAAEKTGLETVLQAQVELAQLEIELVQLDQARAKAKAQLIKALHAPPGATIELKPLLPETNVPRTAAVLVALIDQCQPKLDALRREMNRDQAALALADKNYYPDVTIGMNWYSIGSPGLSPVANGNDATSLLVGVNLPIYRQKLHAAVREAQFQAARTSQQYDATWDALRANVQTLHAEATQHDRIAKILDKTILPKAKQTLTLSLDAFRVDRITFPQLIENYKTLLRYRLDYHRREAQRAQALAALERAVGCAITTWPPNSLPVKP